MRTAQSLVYLGMVGDDLTRIAFDPAARALAVVEELTIPNVWWWASAPTYRDLEDFVMPAFFAQVPEARSWVVEGTAEPE